jgi:hypothetical protein
MTREARPATPAWSRNVSTGIILVAWIVAVAVGLATRHIRFLIVISVASAYLLFGAYLGNARREGRMSKKRGREVQARGPGHDGSCDRRGCHRRTAVGGSHLKLSHHRIEDTRVGRFKPWVYWIA